MIKEATIIKYDELQLGQKYLDGMTITEICKQYNIGQNSLRQYFIIKNIKTRPAKKRKSLRSKAPLGEKFGLWTVVSNEVKSGSCLQENNSRSLYWLVQCECGNLAWKNSSLLKSGKTTRCKKCGNKTFISENGDINVNSIILSKYNQTLHNIPTRKHRGRKPDLTFNITVQYLEKLFNDQNRKCALSGISLEPDLSLSMQKQNLSIDRIDSNIGYEVGNIQWVDKRINMMKGSLSNDEFIYLCTLVSEYNKK